MKIKNLFKIGILLFATQLLVTGCQTENILEDENQSNIITPPKLTAIITNGEKLIEYNTLLKEKLKNIITENKSLKSNDLRNSFVIDTSFIQKIQTSSYTSFTFNINLENENTQTLDNYVLTLFNNGTYVQYLIKYPIINLNNKISYDLTNASIQILEGEKLYMAKSSSDNCTSLTQYEEPVCVDNLCTFGGGHTVADGQNCNGWGTLGMATRTCTEGGYVTVESCVGSSSDSDTYSGTSGGGGSSGGTSDSSSDGETTNDEPDNFDNPIVVIPLEKPDKPDFDEQIFVDEEFKNNPCLKSIYDAMGKASTFNNYLKNFEDEFSVAHLRFSSSSSLTSSTNAETSAPDNYLITITFNENNLDRPRLSVARTFIHEIIHAEIFRKLLSVAQHSSIQLDQNQLIQLRNDYPGLYDYYMRWKWNVPHGQSPSSAQHEAMAQHYRDIIKQALEEFDNTQTEEVYEALAWTGLQNTVAWNNLSQSERDNIFQTIANFNSNNHNCQ